MSQDTTVTNGNNQIVVPSDHPGAKAFWQKIGEALVEIGVDAGIAFATHGKVALIDNAGTNVLTVRRGH